MEDIKDYLALALEACILIIILALAGLMAFGMLSTSGQIKANMQKAYSTQQTNQGER